MNWTQGLAQRMAWAALGMVVVGSSCGMAAPNSLAQAPLFLGRGMNPNVMLLLDNSLSMKAFVPGEGYNKATAYGPCPAALFLNVPSGQPVALRVKADGQVFFQVAGANYDWGLSANASGANGYTVRCFNPSASYAADLGASDTGTYSRGYAERYSGNFLNWYFSDDSHTVAANFGAGQTERPGIRTRMDVAKAAAAELVQDVEDVNLGLSTYSDANALVVQGIADVADESHRQRLVTAVHELAYGLYTPLASAIGALGRYFVEGKTSGVVLGNQTAGQLLSKRPTYGEEAFEPAAETTVIQDFCQANFILALTDGEPMMDNDLAPALQNYANDGDGQPLNDVTKALFERDWRPDLNDANGNPVRNNILSHMIGFGDELVQGSSLLLSAATNGGGKFKTAENALDLAAAFKDLQRSIQARTGSVAGVSFNSQTLGEDSVLFASTFETSNWSGTLTAYPLNPETGIAGQPAWEAATLLTELGADDRTILTHDGASGVAFAWDNLNSLQRSDLMHGSADEGMGRARLAYLRGSRAQEQGAAESGLFRARSGLLGDIIQSGTLFVGGAETGWPNRAPFGEDGARYSLFKSWADSRTPMVYVGANDGMLHGFDATIGMNESGRERLAYIPSHLFSSEPGAGLHALTDPAYEHRYYVDLTPVAADLYFAAAWHTILVGGLRAGGKGYFALDVTDPDQFTEANAAELVRWEYPAGEADSDMGYSYSRPAIAMMNNDTWAVIFGNGYESETGEAVLYLLMIDGATGALGEVKKLRTGAGSALTKNGLGSPAVLDLDGDWQADRIYAADLQGNLWAFDVSASDSAQWGVAHQNDAGQDVPLFQATDATGKPQPITVEPVVELNPVDGAEPNVFVMVGTGQLLTAGDLDAAAAGTQSIYGVRDSGRGQLSRSDLAARFLSARDATTRAITGDAIDWDSADAGQGWYVDLLSPGERVVNDLRVRGDTLFVSALVPAPDTAEQSCDAAGETWLYGLRWFSGLTDAEPVVDANNDGVLDASDVNAAGVLRDGIFGESGFLANKRYTPAMDRPGGVTRNNACGGSVTCDEIEDLTGASPGRTAWVEIFED